MMRNRNNNFMQYVNSLVRGNQRTDNNIINNALGLYRSNNENGLKTLAENLCKQKGIDISQVQNKLNLKL